MIAVQKVGPVAVLVGPYGRRAVFTRVGPEVRYTLYSRGERKHETLTVTEARRRYRWLRGLGYRKWEEK